MATKRAMTVCCNSCCKPSKVICVGCDRHYCSDHFEEHHRTLKKYIDNVQNQCQSLSEFLIEFEQIEMELRSCIDNWKHNTIEKVCRSADEASNELDTFIRNHHLHFEEESSMVIKDILISSDV